MAVDQEKYMIYFRVFPQNKKRDSSNSKNQKGATSFTELIDTGNNDTGKMFHIRNLNPFLEQTSTGTSSSCAGEDVYTL